MAGSVCPDYLNCLNRFHLNLPFPHKGDKYGAFYLDGNRLSVTMEIRKLALTVSFILIAIFSSGQTGYGLKIYQNTDIFETRYHSRFNEVTKVENINFSRISLAIDLDTKRRYTHEIEILIPEFSKPLDNVKFPLNYEFRKDDTIEGKASTFSLRYELSKALTAQDKHFAFLLGAGINPYYVYIEYEPNVSNTYYWSTKLYGFALNITPRVMYRFSQRFSADLNFPFKIYDLRGESNYVDNPSIPIRQRKTTDTSHIFFDQVYTVRIGFMYKLNR